MGRAPCCDKANVKKGPWSPEEDAKLRSYIHQHGTGGNWITLPQKIGLKRCGKSCRLRWLNYLRPNIRHGGFSEEEDRIICSLFISIGSRWSIIASQLPGRTDNDVKNYWNTRLKKKLLGKQQHQRNEPGRRRGRRRTVQESAADGHNGLNAGMDVAVGAWPQQLPYPIEPPASMMLMKDPADLTELGGMSSATTNIDHLLHQQQQQQQLLLLQVYDDLISSVWSSSPNSLQPETSSTATGMNGFWAEMEEMIRFDPARLDYVKGEDEADAVNSAGMDQSMNWNDGVMSHLMLYPSTMMIKGEAAAHEGTTQRSNHLLMQERLHFGM